MLPERRALDELFSVTSRTPPPSSVKRGDQSVTAYSTALVNEAWLASKILALCLVAAALQAHCSAGHAAGAGGSRRRRNARKRVDRTRSLSPSTMRKTAALAGQDLLALDRALDELARLEPRELWSSRFFGGLDIVNG
jgi:hypothetical protein